jgi:hypothetical protein
MNERKRTVKEITMKKLIGLLMVLGFMASAVLAVTNDVSVGSGALPSGSKMQWLTLPVADTTATAAGAADYFTVMTIPAHTVVHAVIYEAKTVAGATCTIDIGDTGSDTRFVTAGNVESATPVITDIASIPAIYYHTANALRVQFNNATAIAKVTIQVLVSKVE